MWLPDALTRPLVVLALSLALTGCFRPMYASQDGAPALTDELARISIDRVSMAQTDEERVSQRVRNELLYLFSAGEATDAPYNLVVTLTQQIEDAAVQPTGEAVTRMYELRASFALIDVANGGVLYGGAAVSRAAHDRSTHLFANQRALLDAENRAAKTIAGIIKTRVAAYMASRA